MPLCFASTASSQYLHFYAAAAYTALFIKLFSELYAGNFAESIVYRRTLGLLAVAELAVFFAVACRRMDVKR